MKSRYIILTISVLALFFYSFRLSSTFEFASDFGRDTLRALELWQNRQITFLGSPLALASLPGNTVFFTSLSLYIGMLGLLISRFSPLGVIIPNILLTTLSIPFFFSLAGRFFKNKNHALLATLIYALSPITVYYARFFWTPNLIIPLSVFFWYLTTNNKSSFKLLAGVLAGVMFHLHYMAIIPLVFYLLVLVTKKEYRSALTIFAGTLIGVTPFLFFEIRNHFFLTRSLLINLQNGNVTTGTVDNGSYLFRLTSFFGTLFGFRSAELSYDNFLGNTYLRITTLIVTLFLMLREMVKTIRDKNRSVYTATIILSLLWLLMTKNSLNIRYLFSLYPILVLFGASMLLSVKSKPLMAVFLLFMVGTSIMRINSSISLTNYSVPLATIEKAATLIVKDDFRGRYNLTENITGDAQAIPFRFFVQRDSINKPSGVGEYANLDGLYVVAYSEKDIRDAKRWEFMVNPTLQLVEEWDAGDVNVYKFLRR